MFDPTGNFLLACSNSGYAALIEVKEDFKVIGLIEFTGEFQSAAFNYEEYEEEGREVCKYPTTVLASFLYPNYLRLVFTYSQAHNSFE